MTEDEAMMRRVVAANMLCKAGEQRYNFSPEERLRFRQAAAIVTETIPETLRLPPSQRKEVR